MTYKKYDLRLSEARGNCVYVLGIEPLDSVFPHLFPNVNQHTLQFQIQACWLCACVDYFGAERTWCTSSIGSSYP